MAGHNRHRERILVELIAEVHRVDYSGDVERKAEPLTAMAAVRYACLAKAEQSHAARQQFGMVIWIGTWGEVDENVEDRCVLCSPDILQLKKNAVGWSG